MRNKTTAAIVLIALAGAITFSVTGQEEPLPVITPKAAPTVVLAVEPIFEFHQPTILEAAQNNDYFSFSALYTEAVRRGDDVSQFATLHELWTYSVTDPIGAFYGAEMYEKLRRAYPGYAAFIDQHKIVDSRGNTFYPTSETRAFLLRNAAVPAAGPQASSPALTKKTPPTRVAARDAARPAGGDAGVPQPAPTVAQAAPVAAPVVAQQAPPVVEPVVITPAPAPVAQTDTAIIATRDNPTGRGILLVIVGLIGVGLLALILQTPREQPPVSIIQSQPPNNVEPMRKTDAPAPPPAAGTKAS